MKPLTLLALGALLTACGNKNGPAPADAGVDARAEVTTAEPTTLPSGRRAASPSAEAPPAPDGTDAISGLLAARHTDDLPGRDTLDQHAGALESLQWLGEYGSSLNERARALELLALYPEAPSDLLVRIATDDSLHPSLIAAALRGLASRDLEGDATLREVVLGRLRHEDVRVGVASATALRDVPSATEALDALAADESISAAVREAATRQ